MIAGFTGHLLSEQFLEQQLERPASAPPDRSFDLEFRQLREQHRLLGPASSLRTMLETGATGVVRALGFDVLTNVDVHEGAASATLVTGGVPVALIAVPWGEGLDAHWRGAVLEARRRNAAWCLLFNGTHVRLVSAARLFSRRFAEFDLDCVADDPRTACAARTLIGAGAFARRRSPSIASLDDLVSESERFASGICRSLRAGVLEASQHVLRALIARRQVRPVSEVFEQSLTIVYRMLFLFFAEGRSLVPSWHPIYRDSYSLERLSDRALTSGTTGLWDTLRAVARLAHAGCRAGDLRVAPFNGRLFAPARTPLAERRDLDNEAARQSLVALSTRRSADGEGRERIAYRDLGVEELGGVYETLLDYTPAVRTVSIASSRRTRTEVSLQPGSGVRKATGTFYTPQSIVRYLLRETLRPLVRDATPERILSLKLLDPAMGSGAFLVSACSYLSEAYEAAVVKHDRCHPSDIGPRERATIRRLVAERCLYGVDLNPMAVQLARLSLWLATLAADRPLSFLDHHLQVGDSLLGVWISALRHPPADRRRQAAPLPLFEHLPPAETFRAVLPLRFSLGCEPNDTLEQVRAKERTLAVLADRTSALSKWKRVADLWCARWFAPELRSSAALFGALSDEILTGSSALPHATAEDLLRAADHSAGERRFFHWEIEFPEVFFNADGNRRADGGFDVVVGNPPWDMVRADQGAGLRHADSRAETGAVVRFTRDSGVYEAQRDGHPNRYQLFLERTLALTRPGGRLGLVLPSGLAADRGSAGLRRFLFSRCGVDALVGFDNRRCIFPIHRSVRFHLLTGTVGEPTASFGCRLGETDPSVLDQSETDTERRGWFRVRVTPELLEHLSGDDLSVPDLRTAMDLAIAEKVAALFKPLGSDAGWAARFGRELNATDNRASLEESGSGLSVVEGKLIEPYRIRLGEARYSIERREARRLLGDRHQRWRLAYRDVASPTNRLTLIAALLPPSAVSTHTVFCLRTALALQAQRFLCGLFNSLVVNFLVRLRVTTHVTTAIVERLPIPRADEALGAYEEIAVAAQTLSRRDDHVQQAKVNAVVARLYQLSEKEFAHILETFPLIAKEDRDRAMHEFMRM